MIDNGDEQHDRYDHGADEDNTSNDGNATNGDKISPGLGDFLAVGVASGISVGGGLILGMFLDSRFHTDPYLTFSGLGLGIVLAGGVIFSEVKKYL